MCYYDIVFTYTLLLPILLVKLKFRSSVNIHPLIRLVSKIGEPCGLACALLMSQMRKLVSHPNPHKHYVKAHISCTTTTMNSILLSLMVTLETETDLSCTQGELLLCISMESFYDPAFLPTKMARLIIHVESTTLLNWDTANQLERWVTEVSRRQHPKKGWCVVWVWGSRVLGAPPGAWDKWWQETALGFLPDLTNWTPGKGVREQLILPEKLLLKPTFKNFIHKICRALFCEGRWSFSRGKRKQTNKCSASQFIPIWWVRWCSNSEDGQFHKADENKKERNRIMLFRILLSKWYMRIKKYKT